MVRGAAAQSGWRGLVSAWVGGGCGYRVISGGWWGWGAQEWLVVQSSEKPLQHRPPPPPTPASPLHPRVRCLSAHLSERLVAPHILNGPQQVVEGIPPQRIAHHIAVGCSGEALIAAAGGRGRAVGSRAERQGRVCWVAPSGGSGRQGTPQPRSCSLCSLTEVTLKTHPQTEDTPTPAAFPANPRTPTCPPASSYHAAP